MPARYDAEHAPGPYDDQRDILMERCKQAAHALNSVVWELARANVSVMLRSRRLVVDEATTIETVASLRFDVTVQKDEMLSVESSPDVQLLKGDTITYTVSVPTE